MYLRNPIPPLPALPILLLALLACVSNAQSNSTIADDAGTLLSITQLLSLFSLSLDAKNFPALRDVFAPDAVLDGGATPITGLPAIEAFYTATFQNASLRTQHTSDTVFGFNLGATKASSVSYASAVYFGPPVLERGGAFFPNQSVVYREKFEDEFVRVESGEWRISRQTLSILVCFVFPLTPTIFFLGSFWERRIFGLIRMSRVNSLSKAIFPFSLRCDLDEIHSRGQNGIRRVLTTSVPPIRSEKLTLRFLNLRFPVLEAGDRS